MSKLEAVRNWRLEARQEDSPLIFFRNDFERITDGHIHYVLGRKGTGKSAISRYIENIHRDNFYATVKTLEDFPYAENYRLTDDSFENPYRYISVWKYYIYCALCTLLSKDESISPKIRKYLKKHINASDPISKWTSIKVSLNVFNIGGGEFELSRDIFDPKVPIGRRVALFEESLALVKTNSEFFILFDQLDEGFSEIVLEKRRQPFIELVTGLLKSVSSVTSFGKSIGIKIVPIVFLRNDIFDLVTDPNKSKWFSQSIDLTWSNDDIRRLLIHRINHSDNEQLISNDDSWTTTWRQIFHPHQVKTFNRRKNQSIFSFISKQTLNRPRDFVFYISKCAEIAISRDNIKITGPIVRNSAYPFFSDWLLEDLIGEIVPLIPDIHFVVNVLRNVGKRVFTIDEFENSWEKLQKSHDSVFALAQGPQDYGISGKSKITYILNILFWYGIIGNLTENGILMSRIRKSKAIFHPNQRIIVHHGLCRTLGYY